jgi:hypothetical protein
VGDRIYSLLEHGEYLEEADFSQPNASFRLSGVQVWTSFDGMAYE